MDQAVQPLPRHADVVNDFAASIDRTHRTPRTNAALKKVADARDRDEPEWKHHDELIKSHVDVEIDLNRAIALLRRAIERKPMLADTYHTIKTEIARLERKSS